MEKKCEECGKLFSTKYSFQRYCCEQHEKRHWAKRVGYNQRPEVKDRLREWSKLHQKKKLRYCKCGSILEKRKRYCNKCKQPIIKKIRFCKICNKPLKNKNKSYCNDCKNSESFREYKRQQIRDCLKNWYKKPGNKERIYAHLKRYRRENRCEVNQKNNSRKRTIELYHLDKLILKYKKCRDCGSDVYVQFHHEIYPSKRSEIIKAVKEGKIYFLCRKCHGKKRRKNLKDNLFAENL